MSVLHLMKFRTNQIFCKFGKDPKKKIKSAIHFRKSTLSLYNQYYQCVINLTNIYIYMYILVYIYIYVYINIYMRLCGAHTLAWVMNGEVRYEGAS